MNNDLTEELENYHIKTNSIPKTKITYDNKYDKYIENTENLWKTEQEGICSLFLQYASGVPHS